MRKLLDQGFLAADAPQTMIDLCDPVGATFYFRVRGEVEGPLWGTDVYTGDSAPGGRRGPCRPGQAGRDRDRQSDGGGAAAKYQGSVRHGVTSHDFGRYGTAYQLSAI